MTHNKTLITALFLAASASFLSMPASAQPNGCMDGGRMGDRMQSMRADHMKQRQQQLHDALKLSAEQEKGWVTYQESFRDMKPQDRPGRDATKKLSAPERAEQMLEYSRKHQERMAQHVTALKTFYATLTPEQQKVFDEQQAQRPQRGDRKPGGRGPGNPPVAN